MKLDPNMEIDRLLRRHARRGAAVPIASTLHHESGGGVRAEESGMTHLDADELNAFAENAVPATARARYAAHLAECDACRKIVTELVLTSGVAQELERQAVKNVASSTTTTAPARSWGARLSALFAPQVLRYAASVVVLVGVVAITFFVFRGGRSPSFTTEERKSSNASPIQKSEEVAQERSGTATDQNVTNTNSATPPESVASKPDAYGNAVPPTTSGDVANGDNITQPAPVQGPLDSPAAPASVPSGTLAGKASEPARDEDAVKTGRQDTTASTINEKSKDNKEIGGADSSASGVSLADKRAEDRTYEAQTGASAENKQRPANQEQSPASTNARKRVGARAQSPPASAAKSEADSRAERESSSNQPEETRRAGGRQFVRRGRAWVDTSYKSQATTNMKRNSDQYRALAADEPGLRAIADQLGGEVIIVWKGRAYRIH